METEKLSDSFIETIIKNEKIWDLVTDLTDFSIKNILDGPLNDLPFIKHLVGITKFGISVRDSFLIKKILKFLKETQKLEQEKKEKFIKKIEADKEYSNRVGNHLINILDRYDHLTKADYLAKLFCAYIDERINYQDFLRLSSSIEKSFIDDLTNLDFYYNRNLESVDEYILQNLYQCGLVSLQFNMIRTMVADQPGVLSAIYVRNNFGMIFCKIVSNYSQSAKLIAPTLNDLENKIFESICKLEDINQDFVDFDKFIEELKELNNLEDEEMISILTRLKNLNLLERTQQVTTGKFLEFYTSFFGYDFYFKQLKSKNEILKSIVKDLMEDILSESGTYSRTTNVSKRRVEHCLMLLRNKSLISITEHSSGLLVNRINKLKLEMFVKNIEN